MIAVVSGFVLFCLHGRTWWIVSNGYERRHGKNDIHFDWPWAETDTFRFCVLHILTKSTRFVHIKRFKIVAGEEKRSKSASRCRTVCVHERKRERERERANMSEHPIPMNNSMYLKSFLATLRVQYQTHWHFIRITFCCCFCVSLRFYSTVIRFQVLHSRVYVCIYIYLHSNGTRYL